MLDFMYHMLGLCGEVSHPNLFMVVAIVAVISIGYKLYESNFKWNVQR